MQAILTMTVATRLEIFARVGAFCGGVVVQVENEIGKLALRGECTGSEFALDAQDPLG